MQEIAAFFRQIVVAVLLAGSALLAALLAYLIVMRALRELRFQWRERIKRRYRDHVDLLLRPEAPRAAYAALVEAPDRHRGVISELLLAPLRVAHGTFVGHLRTAAAAIGRIDRWLAECRHRRWWVRAEAARALGLMQEPDALEPLIALLDDDHEEVRAAAAEALGRLKDPRALRPLIARLGDPSRHQRARVIAALRGFGDAVTPELLAYARERPAEVAALIRLLGTIGGAAAATDDLIAWAADSRPAVRTAALEALGTIGLEDRAVPAAIAGLSDPDKGVRAMAARALGRSRRLEAATKLAECLDDEWIVAAHAAMALRSLGPIGLAHLAARRSAPGQAGELARQMLWEREAEQRSQELLHAS